MQDTEVLGQGADGERPILPLGPMTGDAEYIQDMAESLVRVFSVLIGNDFKLQDAPSGSTDCKTVINIPFSDPEGYLIAEHEISHPLFGTDLSLTETFREMCVERLLRRAGIPSTHPDAIPYKGKLENMVHHLWNLLEDHRCRFLWGELYPAGAEFLAQRWHDIAKHLMEDQAKSDLLSYLGRKAAGVDTDEAPDVFRRCDPHLIKARNLVEGVDAAACLAITGRLIDDIADELLDSYPPSKKQEAIDKLQVLAKAMAAPGSAGMGHGDNEQNPMGGKDLQPPSGQKRRPSAQQKGKIRRLLTARTDDHDEDGMSTFDQLIESGANSMQERLEDARAAMCKPKQTPEKEAEILLSSAAQVCRIPSKFIVPTGVLPNPSHHAGKIRKYIEKVKMRREKRLVWDGEDLDIEMFIDARINGETLETRLFHSEKKEAGLDLLLLLDVSGSMSGWGIQLLEQAIADVQYACKGAKVLLSMWGFSDKLYFYKKLGSPMAPGVQMGSTQMVQALDVAWEWARRDKLRRAVILLTDGFPTSVRGRKSTGSPIKDLETVLSDMRKDSVVLSVLAIGNSSDMYDTAFGKGRYGMVESLDQLPTALSNTAKVLVEAHLKRGR